MVSPIDEYYVEIAYSDFIGFYLILVLIQIILHFYGSDKDGGDRRRSLTEGMLLKMAIKSLNPRT